MTGLAYYNEHDPLAAAWLRELIANHHIAPGHVDERSIKDVRATDLAGFTQCHFFAGIGVWSAALRGAGWSDGRSVWTGSCPCQPFSGSGKKKGFADDRHLWPEFFRLIAECRPDVVFGEQVASKDGLAWLDLVHADLEGAGYAVGEADLCAAGIGAPHIRQRLYWVADSSEGGRAELGAARLHDRGERWHDGAGCSTAGVVGHAERARLEGHGGHVDDRSESGRLGALAPRSVAETGDALLLAYPGCSSGARWSSERSERPAAPTRARELADSGERGAARVELPGPTNGHWGTADWLLCRDGNWRPVEPGTFPLAHGAPERVGRLRGYGNAIVKELAETFIEAFVEARAELELECAA